MEEDVSAASARRNASAAAAVVASMDMGPDTPIQGPELRSEAMEACCWSETVPRLGQLLVGESRKVPEGGRSRCVGVMGETGVPTRFSREATPAPRTEAGMSDGA